MIISATKYITPNLKDPLYLQVQELSPDTCCVDSSMFPKPTYHGMEAYWVRGRKTLHMLDLDS